MALADCRMSVEGGPAARHGNCVALSVSSLRKSIGFYVEVFDCRVVEDARHCRHPYVIMAAPDQTTLVLHEDERLNADSTGAVPRFHLGLAVGDLERTRASLWDFGVPLAAGSREPDTQVGTRSIRVTDPDGHRIELIETRGTP